MTDSPHTVIEPAADLMTRALGQEEEPCARMYCEMECFGAMV